MRIRIACGLDSPSWAGFWKNDRAAVRAVRTIQYNNLLFYLLFMILYNIYNLLFIRLAVITHNWISLPFRQGAVEGKVRIRTANYFFFFSNFRHVLNHVCILLDVKYEVYFILYIQPMKMEQIECSETSAYNNQMPGKYPKEYIHNFFFV